MNADPHPAGVTADFLLDWGDEEQMSRARAVQELICAQPQPVLAVAYPGEDEPPYVAHVYLLGHTQCFAGVVARDDRWPTLDEIEAALTAWRAGVAFAVRWHSDPTVTPPGPHCNGTLKTI